MNKQRIWMLAGLGILTTCISILAAKKYKKYKGKKNQDSMSAQPRYRERVQ